MNFNEAEPSTQQGKAESKITRSAFFESYMYRAISTGVHASWQVKYTDDYIHEIGYESTTIFPYILMLSYWESGKSILFWLWSIWFDVQLLEA